MSRTRARSLLVSVVGALLLLGGGCANREATHAPASGVDVVVGDLAATRPSAARVLHERGIDFCCGGRRTLAEISRELGLDPHAILAEIEAADRAEGDAGFVRWGERSSDELMDHIVATYHVALRRELPRLLELSQRVDRAHADKATRPQGLTAHLTTMSQEIEEHLRLEEDVLFPKIRAGATAIRDAGVKSTVGRLVTDHEGLGQALARTRQITNDFTPPAEACPTWRALYSGLEELEEQIHAHAHLENNVLFPKVSPS